MKGGAADRTSHSFTPDQIQKGLSTPSLRCGIDADNCCEWGPEASAECTLSGCCDRLGQTQLMKLVNNLINAANMATAFEALVLGAKGGLDPDQMVDILNVSTGQNSATLTKVPKTVLPGTFDYGSSLTIMLKDVVSGLREAEALGVPMWVHGTVGQLWRFAEQQGLGPADFTSLIKVMEGWAGVEVRSRG
jgi:3-hydroxyisobutyrate dehydrogenase-like beta-hydroxyacid dehydrogenase